MDKLITTEEGRLEVLHFQDILLLLKRFQVLPATLKFTFVGLRPFV
jgi:hypothetical protein